MLMAHLTNINGVRKEQSLKEHCSNASQYASESIGDADFHNIVYVAGLLHDIGKAKIEFANYLEKIYKGNNAKRGSINHTFAGVIWLFERYHNEGSSKWEKLTCEIISYAIGSHHGMFDCVDLDGNNGFLHRLEKDRTEICYKEAVDNYFAAVADERHVDDCFNKAVKEVENFFNDAKNKYNNKSEETFFQISMLIRLTLSAVIYGDRRDTNEFMNNRNLNINYDIDWSKRKDFFENKMLQLESCSLLNSVRNDISRQCAEAALNPPGIYRLNVPTGAGKTLCSLRYALTHAKEYNKNRIIFIIPLLSVLDQNVKVMREYIPNENELLEHHSNIVNEISSDETLDEYEFLGESWNFPIVVSTLVQLLEILFSCKTSSIGRMQALCDSVIIIDEVQSLPKNITFMFNMAMNFLQRYCNATIILSSATQPCFDELKWPLNIAKNPDMVKLAPEQMKVFERTEIIDKTDKYGMDWDECAEFCGEIMENNSSLLFVCNTKKEARTLFEKMQKQAENCGWKLFHLSTAMCQKHRMKVLEDIKEILEKLQGSSDETTKGLKLVCISTQLIEAGVDISFECVVRVLAGLDNLAQSAGRCNRSNEYGKTGKVYLIRLKNENLSMLKEIKNSQNSAAKAIEKFGKTEDSLIGENAVRYFYRCLFEETKDEIKYPIKDYKKTLYIADLLSNKNDEAESRKNKNYILRQPFKTVGTKFKVFDQDTTDVIVPYENGMELIEKLKSMQKGKIDFCEIEKIVKQAKHYTISIYEWQLKKLEQTDMIHSVFEGRILILDEKAYDDNFGLTMLEERPVDDYIV